MINSGLKVTHTLMTLKYINESFKIANLNKYNLCGIKPTGKNTNT